MRRIIVLSVLCMTWIFAIAQGGNNGGFNPPNPGNPTMPDTVNRHRLSVSAFPKGAAVLSNTGGMYNEGDRITLGSKANTGYKFLHWMESDNVISETEVFEYVMPDKDASPVAVYVYSPDNPNNPDMIGPHHYLRVAASPSHSGTFNVDSINSLSEGEVIDIVTYPAVGYKFKGWYENGVMISDSYACHYQMGNQDSKLIAQYEYNPDNPHDYGSYIWIQETGELIADIYPAGVLSSLIEHPDDVQILTLSGFLNEADLAYIKNLTKLRILNVSKCIVYSGNEENTIPDNAFSSISTLQEVYMPSSSVRIGKEVLANCPNLLEVFWNTRCNLNADALVNSGSNTNLLVYVPEGCSVNYVGNVIYGNVAPVVSLQYGKSFRCSKPFKAEEAIYSREFRRITMDHRLDNGWETMVLPFMPSSLTGARRGELRIVESKVFNSGNCYVGELTDKGFVFVNSITPNTPLVFNAALSEEMFGNGGDKSSEIITFRGINCLVHITDERIKTGDEPYEVAAGKELFVGTWPKTAKSGDVSFHPVYEPINAADNIYTLNVAQVGNVLPGGVFVNNGGNVEAMSCYCSSSSQILPENIGLDIRIDGEPDTYTINYYVDGELYHTATVEEGAKIPVIDNPVKTGHTFVEWSGLPADMIMPSHDIETNAVFTINSYTFTFNSNGGSEVAPITAAYGSVITKPADPVREGYTFVGWNPEIPEYMPAYDMTFTAQWEADAFAFGGLMCSITSRTNHTVEVTGVSDNDITELVVPASVEYVGVTYSVTTVASKAFADCPNLLEVTFEGVMNIPADVFSADAVERNLFVYAPAGSTSEYKGNVVIGGVAENVILHDAKPLRLSQEFTANKVSYSREFSKQTYPNEAGGWETIVLPFDVKQVVSEKGDVLTPFRSGVEDSKHFWLAGLTSNGFGRASTISANIPYIICMPNSTEYDNDYNITGLVTFSAENAAMHRTMDATTYNGNAFKLVPAYEGADASVDVYAINDNEMFGHHAGALFVSDSRAVRPFEAYAANISGGAKPIFFTIGSEDATGITDISMSADTHNMMYDLSGRRVNSQQKGIVIMRNANGKYSKIMH